MRVLVVGAGTMGHGIATVCAIAGFDVDLVDLSEEVLESAKMKIGWSLKKLEERKEIKNAIDLIQRIRTSTNLAEASKNADFVIEAVIEKTEVKREVFRILDENCKPNVILATNTSTIPISDIASATKRPEKIIGLHFFNPPVMIKFVEIVKGEKTSEETLRKTIEFVKSIKMDYIVVEKEVPGFVVNRINVRIFNEAVKLIEEGDRPEEIDAVVRHRIGMPMGLLEVVDFSGVDVLYNVIVELRKRGMDVEVSETVKRMIEDNRLGMKTGRGFYEYEGFYSRAKILPKFAYRLNPLRLLASGVNEACWLIRNGVASKESIDKAMVLGMAYPKGILELADDFGIDNVVEALRGRNVEPMLLEMVAERKLGKKTGEGFYKWKYERKEFGPVIYEKRDNYALITMNRADKLNALNEEMWKGLNEAFIQAEKDPDIRAVVLTGKGRAFCAGDDIAVMGTWKSFLDGKDFFMNVAMPLLNTIANYKKPIISLVNGIAFGGGLEINLAFDIVIASEDAIFSVPEGLIGAIPPIASSLGLAVVGRRMMRYCLTGDQMDAEEAKQLGIVDIVVSKDQLEITGVEFVNKILRLAPLSAKAIKETARVYRDIFRFVVEKGLHEIIELIPTEDFSEGMRAFIQRRRPSWSAK
ncbi:MAG: 3-hydroxyacyl-CoA dehydrogenase/enoyl-CoA hydratase family protein [Archaeoglobaceae archaeon]|nr:3-hydroxyacyl-CoA dehydrogenase/enoyl-CoA hydratase family protein [Archaeoglobaceae archaeon]MDW8118386.1 3-hydroxyacyl-CoA dehydrogenase/enoyl-CoA hydratase family protein [Archaeoglobaceae archaeon]